MERAIDPFAYCLCMFGLGLPALLVLALHAIQVPVFLSLAGRRRLTSHGGIQRRVASAHLVGNCLYGQLCENEHVVGCISSQLG